MACASIDGLHEDESGTATSFVIRVATINAIKKSNPPSLMLWCELISNKPGGNKAEWGGCWDFILAANQATLRNTLYTRVL